MQRHCCYPHVQPPVPTHTHTHSGPLRCQLLPSPYPVCQYPQHTHTHRFATYQGIDTCGQRLADEVRAVAAAHPSLTRLSVVAHSMGGLMARYALGALFNPGQGRVAGLEPCHFVSMATPHCGCDADGVAQVWAVLWV